MSKKKLRFEKVEPVVTQPVAVPLQESLLTLEMYCSRMGIHQRSIPGMKAYTKVTRASFETWEKIFATY